MSHNAPLRFQSKTSFQALAVESGEESEEEEVEEVQQDEPTDVKESETQPQSTTESKQTEVSNETNAQQPAGKKAAKATTSSKKEKKAKKAASAQSDANAAKSKPSYENLASAAGVEPSKSSLPNELGSATNPVMVPDETPVIKQSGFEEKVDPGIRELPSVPKNDPSKSKSTAIPVHTDEHTFKLIGKGPDGVKHEGNLEVHVSSSEQVMSPLPHTSTETLAEKVQEANKKHANVFTRSLWTFVMIGGFIGLLLMGHIYMIMLVLACQTIVFREVTALFSLSHKEPENLPEIDRRDPWSKTLNWYFFVVTNYFLYGETIIYYFKHIVFAEVAFLPFVTNHRFISFTLYCIGFVGFVASLKKIHLKRQFSLFGWVHMTLLLIVFSSHFIVNNILEGMIWFWVPASLVICNDIFAYIWGVTTGRTPLLALSPKKTVEGFVGAIFSTLIFGYFWGTFFMRYNYMICPVEKLGVTAWSNVVCKPNPVFVWREWRVPFSLILPVIGKINTISWAPYQFHVLVMATFASLVAPFGGFFASGFKRAFNIKDFGDSIPGHGGMTDRMDCQFLMGMFSYVYYSTVIREHHVTVGSLLQAIVSGLTVEEQIQLFSDLKHLLESRGVIS